MNASQLRTMCEAPDPRLAGSLRPIYGEDEGLLGERVRLLQRTLDTYLREFGDTDVRVFRCPGRINLRGMHVDTHGGYLNLMTHQREIFAILSPTLDSTFTVGNVDPQFETVTFDLREWTETTTFRQKWHSWITDPSVQGPVLARRGHWRNYVEGAALRVQHHWRDTVIHGFRGVVGSDLPRGAALSSSTALTMAILSALVAFNQLTSDQGTLIRLGSEAEWYTGARGGMSDQAAMVLGNRNEFVNIAIRPGDLDTSRATHVTFPKSLRVLVINSRTERSLSGAELVEYTRNRFAYSLAMEILRQELRRTGLEDKTINDIQYLSDFAAAHIESLPREQVLYACLARIPEGLEIEELRKRYDLPQLDAAYDQYFATAPPELRPTQIGLRGPLLFGIAESERARLFAGLIRDGRYERAGQLMTWGHDGDRRRATDGLPYRYDVSDRALERLARAGAPLEECPGAYGASSPALDVLVDAASQAGALGASLTGGGIAGTVLALCRAESCDRVAHAVKAVLGSDAYAETANLKGTISGDALEDSVLINQSVAPVGELSLE